jgi:hypothetical protein
MKTVRNIMIGLILAVGMSHADVIRSGEITVEDDAHVRGGTNAETNYGTHNQLWVRNTTGANDQLKIYLEANAGGILASGEIFSNAALTLKSALDESGSSTVSLYGIVDNGDAWTESGITWNNAPKNDTASGDGVLSGTVLLATLDMNNSVVGTDYTFADARISEYLNWTAGAISDPYGNGASGDQLATFILVSSTQGVLYRFTSSENTLYGNPNPSVSYDVIPEPATLGMLMISSAGILAFRRVMQ